MLGMMVMLYERRRREKGSQIQSVGLMFQHLHAMTMTGLLVVGTWKRLSDEGGTMHMSISRPPHPYDMI